MPDNEALKDLYQDEKIIANHSMGYKIDQAKDSAVEKLFGKDNKPTINGRIRDYMKDWTYNNFYK